jgi:hypothetical protein
LIIGVFQAEGTPLLTAAGTPTTAKVPTAAAPKPNNRRRWILVVIGILAAVAAIGAIVWRVEESSDDDANYDDDDDKSDEYLSGVYVFWSAGVSSDDGRILRGWWNTTTETVRELMAYLKSCVCEYRTLETSSLACVCSLFSLCPPPHYQSHSPFDSL